jgi:hypothetical protein
MDAVQGQGAEQDVGADALPLRWWTGRTSSTPFRSRKARSTSRRPLNWRGGVGGGQVVVGAGQQELPVQLLLRRYGAGGDAELAVAADLPADRLQLLPEALKGPCVVGVPLCDGLQRRCAGE